MAQLDRIAVASRAFCLAAALGLALLTSDLIAVQYVLLLAAVAIAASWLGSTAVLHRAWIAIVESLFAALLVGLAADGQPELVPYLMAPPLVAGLVGGLVPLVITTVTQSACVLILTVNAFSQEAILDRVELTSPWLIISFGVGLLGAWIRAIGLAPTVPAVDDSYESARRLVTQLRTVARRLSSGLDPVGMANQLQGSLGQHLDGKRSAIFVRTEGGVLSPLTYRGVGAREMLRPDDSLVDACWAEMEPAHAAHPDPDDRPYHRIALPLRAGSRMIGVALADTEAPPSTATLKAVMRVADETSLRLDTALAFDEVRSIATVEERQRLAREIHDGIAQEVASLGYAVDDMRAGTEDPELVEKLTALRGELTRVVSELRLSIFDLRSDVETTSLGIALTEYVQQVGSRSNMTVHLTLDEAPTRLRSEVETELLRIAQEAITNARKHSAAENLWVDCRIQPPYASIRIRDDGTGLGKARVDSYGLRIMQERAARIGAKLDIYDHRGDDFSHGTVVSVRLGDEDTSADEEG